MPIGSDQLFPSVVHYLIQSESQKTVKTGTWTLESIEAETSRLNLIKETLLNTQEVIPLPSYYFSDYLLGYNKQKKIIVMCSFQGSLRLSTPMKKFYSNKSINSINKIDGMFRLPKLAVNEPLQFTMETIITNAYCNRIS